MCTIRQQQKAQTRAQILRAAAGRFAERGFEATSIAEIAAAMGRPKSALGYHQFRSKDELARAVVELQLVVWRDLRDRSDAHQPAGVPRLLTLLLSAALDARENPFGLASIRLVLESRRHGAFDLPDLPFDWFDYCERQIADAVRLGQLPTGTAPRETGLMIVNSSFGLFEAENQGFREIETEAGLRDLWLRLLAGLGAADPPALLAATVALPVLTQPNDQPSTRSQPEHDGLPVPAQPRP